MPHFSKSAHQFNVPISSDKQYRVSAWINCKTDWDDNAKRYEPMTDDQKQKCEEMFRQFQASGCQISVTIQERTNATDEFGKPDVRQFPKVGVITLYTSNYAAPKHVSESIAVDTSTAPAPTAQNDDDYVGIL